MANTENNKSVDLEIALEYVNQVLVNGVGRSLRPPEITVFCGTWQGITYEQMADSSSYSANYLMRDIAPKFWKLLTTVFERNIGKSNLKIQLCKLYDSSQVDLEADSKVSIPNKCSKKNWSNQIAFASVFYGRTSELATLSKWTVIERCKLIKLLGLSGMGKSLLMKQVGEQIQDQYEQVIWRSLSSAPKLKELLADLLLSGFGIAEKNESKLLSILLEQMRSHPCLIMLDGVEAILQPQTFSGKYLPDYENYHDFFQAVGESFHQSCVMVTSIENFGKNALSGISNSSVRQLSLSGLSSDEAKSLLSVESTTNNPDHFQSLIEYYQGNPAMLIIAAQIIRELFNGNTKEFLEQKSLVFGEINSLLDKSFERLSTLETEILYWLASEPQPMSLSAIQNGIPLSIYPVELIEALESLTQRSLVTTTQIQQRSVFVLSSMMREFIINQFIAQIGNNFSLANRRSLMSSENTIELGVASQITHLSQWLQNKFEPGWQSVETLFTASGRSPARLRSAFSFRGEGVVKRFKRIALDTGKFKGILLLIAVSQEEVALKICVQAQPTLLNQTLPSNLQLNLLDPNERILATIAAEAADNFIQLPYFRGMRKEKFKIEVVLGEQSYLEEFLI